MVSIKPLVHAMDKSGRKDAVVALVAPRSTTSKRCCVAQERDSVVVILKLMVDKLTLQFDEIRRVCWRSAEHGVAYTSVVAT